MKLFFARLRGQAGMTATEIMVGTAIAGIIAVILGTTIYTAVGTSREIMDRLDTEVDLLRAEAVLRDVLQTAVDVHRRAGGPVAPGAAARSWFLEAYDSNPGDPIVALGHFYREDRKFGSPPVGTSLFKTTAVFFQPPSANGQTSGVLFVDLGADEGSGIALRPDYGDIHVGNIVDLVVREPWSADTAVTALGFDSLLGITIDITIRYFTTKDSASRRCFLHVPGATPAAQAANTRAACAARGLVGGHDITRTFRIALFNSDMGPTPSEPVPTIRERGLGRVYVFPLLMPTSSRQAP